ncbi:MAG: thioesterase family protein [Candidatus Omnitrophota bacterium]
MSAKNQHAIELRVRYAETDQMGVVYYANYLVWFEIARTEFFREKGISYRKIEEDDKIYLPVVEAYCRYSSPLKYDDQVTVIVVLTDIGKMRMFFEYEVKKQDKVTALGETKHAFMDKNGAPIPIPDKIRKVLENH